MYQGVRRKHASLHRRHGRARVQLELPGRHARLVPIGVRQRAVGPCELRYLRARLQVASQPETGSHWGGVPRGKLLGAGKRLRGRLCSLLDAGGRRLRNRHDERRSLRRLHEEVRGSHRAMFHHHGCTRVLVELHHAFS